MNNKEYDMIMLPRGMRNAKGLAKIKFLYEPHGLFEVKLKN